MTYTYLEKPYPAIICRFPLTYPLTFAKLFKTKFKRWSLAIDTICERTSNVKSKICNFQPKKYK